MIMALLLEQCEKATREALLRNHFFLSLFQILHNSPVVSFYTHNYALLPLVKLYGYRSYVPSMPAGLPVVSGPLQSSAGCRLLYQNCQTSHRCLTHMFSKMLFS